MRPGHISVAASLVDQPQLKMTSLLRTWLLVPRELQSSSWDLNIFRGPIYVRAESASQARSLAAQEFRKPNAPASDDHSPWLDEHLVGCVETDATRYTGIDKCVLFAYTEIDAHAAQASLTDCVSEGCSLGAAPSGATRFRRRPVFSRTRRCDAGPRGAGTMYYCSNRVSINVNG